jgi:serine-type D-Ala-D-Ala carboxypeptidase/endopeptidase (penicillin-binding protein 4)
MTDRDERIEMNGSDPRPPRRAPLLLVIVIALLPALGLAGLWRWADTVDDDEPVIEIVTAVPVGPPSPELTTALASLRRTPGPLAARVAEEVFDDLLDTAVEEALADTIGVSCVAVSLDGTPAAGVDEALAVLPASNQKLLVAAVALDVLDAGAGFVTSVRGAPVVEGVLAGDLYLVGGGDPALTSDEVAGSIVRPFPLITRFDDLVDQLVDAGLTRVEGDVVADATRYDDEFLVPSWGPGITRDDGGPISALLVNGGRIFGSGIGLNPAQAAANELNRLMGARGITITGGNRVDVAPDGLEVLGAVESAPLADIVEAMLLVSHNTTAEMLLKEIGYSAAGNGSRPAGMAVVRERLAEWNVPLDGASLEDGSGLSRENAVSCATFTGLLAHAGSDGDLAGALPVAGESGTLTDQLLDTPADGVLRAKTGTLTGAKSLSGFFPTATGEVFEFSVMLEGDGVDDPAVHVPVWTILIDAFAQYPVEPDDAPFGPR